MWQCAKCRENIDENFEVCWNCGTSRDGIEDPAFQEDGESTADSAAPLTCLRCQHALEYAGARDFHEGTPWGVLGNLAELAVKRERFDVYLCSRCGHVEFFVDGIGDELRPS